MRDDDCEATFHGTINTTLTPSIDISKHVSPVVARTEFSEVQSSQRLCNRGRTIGFHVLLPLE